MGRGGAVVGASPNAGWPIQKERDEAQRLKVLADAGNDPRELERQKEAERAAAKAAAAARAVTVGQIWPRYLATGRPKRRDACKPRYLADLHARATQEASRRGAERG